MCLIRFNGKAEGHSSLLKLLVKKYETSAVLLNAEVVFILCLLFSYAFKYKKMIWSRK